MWSYLVMTLLAFLSVLLMFIILLQKGRGGGLAGAFGGMGGQSAFGTRAGDVFTKITVGLAAVWIILAAASGFVLRAEADRRYPGADESETPAAGAKDTSAEDGEAPPPPIAPGGTTKSATPETEQATEPAGDTKTEPAPSETNEPQDPAGDKKAEGTGTSSDAPASEPSPE